MIEIDITTLILLLVVHALIPLTWMNMGPFIPFVVQTLLIITPVYLLIAVFRKSGKKWPLFVLPVVYCLITLISNILVANFWNVHM